MSKTVNLQPWLDYFELLRTYQQKGFLEMHPDKGEAYITEAALYTLGPDSVTRLRAYAGFLSQEGAAYLERPFAVNVVRDDEPHDMKYTFLLTVRRRWWRLWRKGDDVEVIYYGGEEHG